MNRWSHFIWCVLLVSYSCSPTFGQSEVAYSFTLDGEPFAPRFFSPEGNTDRPRAGDLIDVARIRLTLGSDRKCDFVTTPREDGRLMLRLPDGTLRVVGANVDRTYKNKKRVAINPLAKLSTDEIRQLWGVRLDHWLEGIEKQLRHVDVTRTCFTVTDAAALTEPKALPPIPAGIRYLNIDESSNRGLTDLRGLNRLTSLRCLFLDLKTVKQFDLSLIQQNEELCLLKVSCRRLNGTGSLASLKQLQSLDLGRCQGFSDVGFARQLTQLRRLDLRATSVRDLSKLGELDSLVYLNAEMSQTEQLPAGELPALRELRVFSTPLSDDDTTAFKESHPRCQVLHRWTDAFRDQVAKADRLRVRSGGTCHRKISREKTLFEVEDAAEISRIVARVAIDETVAGQHCMCCGDPSFEFFEGERLIAMVGFHHGRSIRWIDGWPGDGVLTSASADALITWLADNGVSGPLKEQQNSRRQNDALQRRFGLILAVVPDTVSTKLMQAKSPADAVKAFTEGVPDPAERAAVCLRVLGCDNGSWNRYTQFESLACKGLLPKLDQASLSAAVAGAGQDQVLADGAARWLFAERKQDSVTAETLAEILPALAKAGLSHPRATNRVETMLALGRIKSAEAIRTLRECLAGEIAVRKLSDGEATEPGGQVVYRPRKVKVNDKYSDKVNAALVLAEIGDRQSLAFLRQLVQNTEGAEKAALDAAIERLAK